MLLAYLDEIGEPGAFIARDDPKYNTSPAFGYAGFIVPADYARRFGEQFTRVKRQLFKADIAKAPDPGKWERKGADIFRPKTPVSYGYQLRAFTGLITLLQAHGGRVFYYADEKPIGTPKQIQIEPHEREAAAMKETLNRLCRFAENQEKNLMVMLDQITEKTRKERLPNMYGHILSRATTRQEMKRIVEPPMHVDSVLSSNIQFADWIAAALTRAIDYQLLKDSPYDWIPTEIGPVMRSGSTITHESKLHLNQRSISDLNNWDVFKKTRPLHPEVFGNSLQATNAEIMAQIFAKSHKPAGRR
jgi:hypothetical protein